MKSPGIVYRRYRQLRRKILYEFLQEARKQEHKNCVYGKVVDVFDKDRTYHLHVCTYNKNLERGLEVCSQPGDCSAFVNRFSKDTVEKEFNKELKDSYIRAKKYPELNLLEWVLDKSLEDAKKNPSILVKAAIFIISLLESFIKITGDDQKRLMEHK